MKSKKWNGVPGEYWPEYTLAAYVATAVPLELGMMSYLHRYIRNCNGECQTLTLAMSSFLAHLDDLCMLLTPLTRFWEDFLPLQACFLRETFPNSPLRRSSTPAGWGSFTSSRAVLAVGAGRDLCERKKREPPPPDEAEPSNIMMSDKDKVVVIESEADRQTKS
jgi:hypothetical protein